MPKNRQNRRGKHPLVDLKDRVRALEEITTRHEGELTSTHSALEHLRRSRTDAEMENVHFRGLFSDATTTFTSNFTDPPPAPTPTEAERIARFDRRAIAWLWNVITQALAVGIGLWAAVHFISL